jgi:hypothetical protein
VSDPVALLVFAPLIFVGGSLSAFHLEARPPSIVWVLAGYIVLAVATAEVSYFAYLNFFSYDLDWGGLLDRELLPFWVMALIFLAAILVTAYAITAQRWGRAEHGRMLVVGFMAVLLLHMLSVILRLRLLYSFSVLIWFRCLG